VLGNNPVQLITVRAIVDCLPILISGVIPVLIGINHIKQALIIMRHQCMAKAGIVF
jgi:hypothetical protein